MLFLSEADVEALFPPAAAVEVVEEAFRELAAGRADNVPRHRSRAGKSILHAMSAAAEYLGVVGWKCYTTTPRGVRFYVGLCDAATAEMIAWIEADRLGQRRTAAATAVAVRHLVADDVSTLGLVGSGWQAEGQLEAVAVVRQLASAVVFSRDAERRNAFAEKMSARLGIDVRPAAHVEDAVREMPLVVTATTCREPVVRGDAVTDGGLVCAIGSNWPQRAEVEASVIGRAEAVVCDDVACCRLEAGDLLQAEAAGAFAWENASGLADVVSGAKTCMAGPERLVFFKSVGMAIEDVAAADYVVKQARERGVGREIEGLSLRDQPTTDR